MISDVNISILISAQKIAHSHPTQFYITSFFTTIQYCDYPIYYFNTDFSTEKQNDDHPTHFYITNFGINFTIAIIHVSTSVLI